MSLFKKNFFSAAIGCIVFIVTVCVYFLLPFKKESMDQLTFAGTVIAQALSFLAVIIFNRATSKKKLALSAGGYTSVFIYFAISAAISVLFSVYCRNAPRTYTILETVLTALFAIASIFIYLTGSKIAADGERAETENDSFKTIEGSIDLMRASPKNAAYKSYLDRIYEAYKSCDQSDYVKTDEKIKEKVDELSRLLQTDPPEEHKIFKLCEFLLQLIKQRDLEVSRLKLGGV